MSKVRYETSPSYELFNARLIARLRKVREDADLTQEDFAKECDISVSTIRKLENGLQKISAYVVQLYCDICHVRATDVLPPPKHVQNALAPNTQTIDAITADLQQLDDQSLELIRVITQHLTKGR